MIQVAYCPSRITIRVNEHEAGERVRLPGLQ
jgi:hypothetical protein